MVGAYLFAGAGSALRGGNHHIFLVFLDLIDIEHMPLLILYHLAMQLLQNTLLAQYLLLLQPYLRFQPISVAVDVGDCFKFQVVDAGEAFAE